MIFSIRINSLIKEKNGKTYATAKDEATGKKLFMERLDIVQDNDLNHEVKIYKYGDIPKDQFMKLRTGLRGVNPNPKILPRVKSVGNLPLEVDYRKTRFLTKIRDQGMCGVSFDLQISLTPIIFMFPISYSILELLGFF